MKDNSFFKWFCLVGMIILLIICSLKAFEYVGPVQRFSKKVKSEYDGGLQRVVTLYSHDGTIIKKWYGKIDLSNSEETDFILDNRRIIIKGGITTIEEEK